MDVVVNLTKRSRKRFPFVETKAIPVGIYHDLLRSAFNEIVFRQWCVRRCAWQLRIIGPPGSGKTTFATLAIRHLTKSFPHPNVRVASIFVNDNWDGEDDEFRLLLLKSLCRQFWGEGPEPDLTSYTVDAMRQKLHEQVQGLQRAFLIVDDIELCRQSLFNQLEQEFLMLQQYGLNVLVTSRVPLHHDPMMATCDADDTHQDATVYWCCATCHGRDETFDGDNVLIICQICREAGIKCSLCDTDDLLYEPYPHINMILKGLLSQDATVFSTFVAQALELAHGDLGIESHLRTKPPHSVLGKSLTTGQAARTVMEICDQAACNIAMAKLRLDIYQGAKVVEDLTRIGDRLPDNFLALFDAAIDRVTRQPKTEKRLGLFAIVTAVQDEKGNTITTQPFYEMERRLQSRGLLDVDPSPESHHNLDRVLRATCGFLWIKGGDPILIEPYHDMFGLYIRENYHDELYRVRLEITKPAPPESG